jgi:peptide/nickel transport system permease protein
VTELAEGPIVDPARGAALAETQAVAPTKRRQRLRTLLHNPIALGAGSFIVLIVVIALLAPWLAPYDPYEQDLLNRLQSPSSKHWLGTDDLGRDQLTRLMYGARTSLVAASEAVGIGVVIGVPLGIIAGFREGPISGLLSWMSDSVMSVPAIISALTIVAILGPGLVTAMFAIGIILVPRFFRISKAATEDVRNETYIEAAISLGCTRRRLFGYHVLPNVLSPVVVQISIVFGIAITAEASLSFLGLGVRPPTASWGSMLSTAASNMSIAPYLVYAPGLVLSLTVLAFALLGDGLRRNLGATSSEEGDAL